MELLQAQPGLEIAQNGGAGSTSSVFIRDANGDHTLVLIDGMRTGSLTTGVTPLESISLDQIDHIEILRGAGYDKTDGFPSTVPGNFYYTLYDHSDEKYSAHFNIDQTLDGQNHIGLLTLYNRDRNEYDAGSNNDYAINQVHSYAAYWNDQFNTAWHTTHTRLRRAWCKPICGTAMAAKIAQPDKLNRQTKAFIRVS